MYYIYITGKYLHDIADGLLPNLICYSITLLDVS